MPKQSDDTNGDQAEDIEEHDVEAGDSLEEAGQVLSMDEFKKQLTEAFAEEKGEKEIWKDVVDKICSFGPRRVGPNILIDATHEAICGRL